MRTTHLLGSLALAAGLATGALAGATALAQDSKTDSRPDASVRLTIPQVYEKLTTLGYKDIDEIERERDIYEVDARTSAGQRVKLHVDARSGQILRTKADPRDRARDGR